MTYGAPDYLEIPSRGPRVLMARSLLLLLLSIGLAQDLDDAHFDMEIMMDGAPVVLRAPLPPLDAAASTAAATATYAARVAEAAAAICSSGAACTAHVVVAAAQRALQIRPNARVAVEALVARHVAQDDAVGGALMQRASACYAALAASYAGAGMAGAALERHKRAARHWPTARTLLALSVAQLEAGALAEAAASASAAAHSLDESSTDAERAAAFNTLGMVRQLQRNDGEAIGAFARAVELRPDAAQPAYNLAFVEAGGARRALASLEQLARGGDLIAATALVAALPRAYATAAEATAWVNRADAALDQLERAARRLGADAFERAVPLPAGVPPHWTHAFSGATIGQTASILTRWSALWAKRLQRKQAELAAPRRLAAQLPLRVGFVSSWFCNSAIGRVMAGAIARLDPAQFETTVYLLRTAGGTVRRDFATAEIVDSAAHSRVLAGSIASARASIAADRLDVLVFTDIGMETPSYFLAFARLAPVQIVFWGHPLTSGIPDSVDYYLLPGSSYADGDVSAAARYTEQLVRLDTMGTHYAKIAWDPAQRAALFEEAAQSVPALRLLADDNGPRGSMHLYAVSQHCRKFHPRFDAALRRILRADSSGWLIVRECAPADDAGPTFLERLRNHSAALAQRVVAVPALPLNQYLAVLATAQVMLEPFPFRGSITTLDAFTVGTPVVTNGGDLGGRATPKLTVALYRRIGMERECCVARDEVDFSDFAVQLAANATRNKHARSLIVRGHDVLFRDSNAVEEWERFLRRAHGLSQSGGAAKPLVDPVAALKRVAQALRCGSVTPSTPPPLEGDISTAGATNFACTAVSAASALAATEAASDGSSSDGALALTVQDLAALLLKRAGLGGRLPGADDDAEWDRRRRGSALALVAAELALAINPKLAHAAYSAAVAALALRQWDRSAAHYRRLVELKAPFDSTVMSPALPQHAVGLYAWSGVADHGPLGAVIAFGAVMYGGQTTALLDHTAEQLAHLTAKGALDANSASFAAAASEEYSAMSTLQRSVIAHAGGACGIDAASEVQHPRIDSAAHPHAAAMHGRIVHVRHTPSLPGGAVALSAAVAHAVEHEFTTNTELAVVDNVLRPDALREVIAFCQDSTIFWRNYIQGYQGAFLNSGFGASGLVLQIAHELKDTFSTILDGLQLRQAWAYKYSGGHPRGIDPHSDDATVSVNCWITADEANLDPRTGGLVVYAATPPEDMAFAEANQGTAAVQKLLGGETVHELHDRGAGMPVLDSVQAQLAREREGGGGGGGGGGEEGGAPPAAVRIAYRQNRCVLFSGRRFHQSDAMRFKRGYKNRRINLTFLFS